MVGVHAGWVITLVKYVHPFRYWAVKENPRGSVGEIFLFKLESSITPFIFAACP